MTPSRKKLRPLSADFTIVPDHRESGKGKVPWMWLERYFEVQWIDPATDKKSYLKIGDYSIKGYENKIALEHKSGIKELYTDLVNSYRPTFKRFLSRLSEMQVRAIIVEEPLTLAGVRKVVRQLSHNSDGRSKLTEETAWHWIARIQTEYDVPILFCDSGCVEMIVKNWLMMAYQQVR